MSETETMQRIGLLRSKLDDQLKGRKGRGVIEDLVTQLEAAHLKWGLEIAQHLDEKARALGQH